MATIVERDIHHHHSDEDSSVGSIIVGLLAIVLIVGLALYAFQVYPFAGNASGDRLNVNIDTTVPATTNP